MPLVRDRSGNNDLRKHATSTTHWFACVFLVFAACGRDASSGLRRLLLERLREEADIQLHDMGLFAVGNGRRWAVQSCAHPLHAMMGQDAGYDHRGRNLDGVSRGWQTQHSRGTYLPAKRTVAKLFVVFLAHSDYQEQLFPLV